MRNSNGGGYGERQQNRFKASMLNGDITPHLLKDGERVQ
jgi:hypothetical protein